MKDMELGYPHELILVATKKAEEVLTQSQYTTGTKILAFLLLKIQGKNPKIKFKDKKLDEELKLIHSIAKNSKFLIKDLRTYRNKFHFLIDQYEKRKSTTSLRELEDFVRASLFIDVLLKYKSKSGIFTKDEFKRIKFLPQNTQANKIFYVLSFYDDSKITENEVNDILRIFDEDVFQETVIFYTFDFSLLFKTYKSQFLYSHYLHLKGIVEHNKRMIEHRHLDDVALERLFKLAVILFICGYNKAIRLSHQEKLNYLNIVLSKPMIAVEFQNAYERCTKVLVFPLWLLLVFSMGFMVASLINEIYTPTSVSMWIISFELPFKLPVFSTMSVLLLLFITWKIFKLKNKISKILIEGD